MSRALVILVLSAGCVVAYDVGDPDQAGSETCAEPQTQCEGECVNLDVDPDDCGACGVVCAPGFACDRGECRDSCRNGRELCGRYCVDANVDLDHCGGCDQPCGDTEACFDGDCEAQ